MFIKQPDYKGHNLMYKKPPNIQLVNLGLATEAPSFLKVKRVKLVAEYPDGSKSKEFFHDIITRKNIDASVIIAYYVQNDMLHIYLRSAVRPAIADRFVDGGNMWELPAGLIENGETPAECAARELKEELGFDSIAEDFKPLGTPVFTSVGLCAEQLYFLKIEVDPTTRGVPTEDGSALEKGADIISVCLTEAMCACHQGTLDDAKTEIGIRRMLY